MTRNMESLENSGRIQGEFALNSKGIHAESSSLRLTLDEITAHPQRDYVSPLTRLRLVVTLLLMLAVGVGSVKAQETPDYSGIYYIASSDARGTTTSNYNSTTPTDNFYLCPTDEENWICYVDPDNYTNPAEDNDQPFLTTYKYRAAGKDATQVQWIIEKAPNSNYYYIIHKNTTRYLTYNGSIATTSGKGVNRLRFHLQSTATDNSRFQIQVDESPGISGAINIIAVAATTNYKYLNISSADDNSLTGTTGKTDGPTGCPNVGATIGIWNDPGRTCEWHLESVYCANPEIQYDFTTKELTITSATVGATIYYTTNGDNPTTESSQYDDNNKPIINERTVIKTFAHKNYKEDSEVVTQTILINPTINTGGSITYNGLVQTPTISVMDGETIIPSSDNSESGIGAFVERLYKDALARESDKDGKDYWVTHVNSGELSGADCAREFLFSKEFRDRNLSDEGFLKILYRTFFDRNYEDDPDGYNFWLGYLKTNTRDSVINGFIESTEWCNICATYGVRSGAIYAKATVASENSIRFATRLYKECLGRNPEADGQRYWSLGLTNQELTGTQAAKEFFYSKEFKDKNLSDEE